MAFKYKAFISYSHQDAHWGKWLHKALETYRVPRSLIGTNGRDGTIAKRLYPIFRDREELPTATDLGNVISQALNDSGYLIVICSPRSASSMWVNQEILAYKRLGRENRILAIIVDGEPNATDKPGMEEQECFPEALKFKLGSNGELSKERTEPIAADARPGKDNREGAKLKLLAGLLGVSFDSLKQREKKRQRIRQLVVGATLVIAGILGTYFWQSYQQKRIEALRAESESLTLAAIEKLAKGDSKGALKNLLAALPKNVKDPSRPILDKTKTVLNRAVAAHQELYSFQGPEEGVKELRLLKGGQLLALTISGDAYLYSQEGGLQQQFVFDDGMGIYLSSDGKRLVAASFVTRKELTKEQFPSTIYVKYFISRTFDLQTGEQLSTLEKRYKDNELHNLFDSRGKAKYFYDDGTKYIGIMNEYSNNTTQYLISMVSVATGEIIGKVSSEKYIREALVTENGTIIAEINDENMSAGMQLGLARPGVYTFLPLWGENEVPACKEGRPVSHNELKDQRIEKPVYGLSADEKYLIIMIQDLDDYRARCLISWELETGIRSKMFSTNIKQFGEGLSLEHADIIKLAYQSKPLLLRLDNEDQQPIPVFKNKIYALQPFKGTPHAYAYAKDSVVNLHYMVASEKVNEGVNVTAMTFNFDGSRLWVAGIDGRIRLWRTGYTMESFATGLDNVNKIHVGPNTLTAIGELRYIYLGKRRSRDALKVSFIPTTGERATKTIALPVPLNFNHVDSKLYANGTRLGIMKNLQVGMSLSNDGPGPAYWLHLFNTENGKEIVRFEHSLGSYIFPPENGTHLAYILKDKVILVSMFDGKEKAITLQEGYHPSAVIFIGEQLLISADDNFDNPDARVTALFVTDDKGITPLKKVVDKKSQGLLMESNRNNKAVLLRWDISWESKVLEVMTADTKIHSVKQTWEDKYGVSYLLSETGNQIYVIQNRKSITKYGLNGEKLHTHFSNQDWYDARLGPQEEYLINTSNFLSLLSTKACNKIELKGVTKDDRDGHYLVVVAEYEDLSQVYDLDTCEIMIEVPFGANTDKVIHLGRDGTFWVASKHQIYRIKTQNSFIENVKIARQILQSAKGL